MPKHCPMVSDPIAEAQRQWVAHGWMHEAPAMATVTSIMRLQQVFLARANAQLRSSGLTFARYELLMLLLFSKRGALPLGKIGERLQVNAASVTNAVDQLEAHGLIVRRSNPSDRRGTLAVITSRGRRVARRATDMMNANVFTDIGIGGPAQQELLGILSLMRRAAGDFD